MGPADVGVRVSIMKSGAVAPSVGASIQKGGNLEPASPGGAGCKY